MHKDDYDSKDFVSHLSEVPVYWGYKRVDLKWETFSELIMGVTTVYKSTWPFVMGHQNI